MWVYIAPSLAALTGFLGLIARVFYRLHQDAVAAESKRADDWRTAAQAAQARADLHEERIAILLGQPSREKAA